MYMDAEQLTPCHHLGYRLCFSCEAATARELLPFGDCTVWPSDLCAGRTPCLTPAVPSLRLSHPPHPHPHSFEGTPATRQDIFRGHTLTACGRPKTPWRRMVEAEMKNMNHSWATILRLVSDRQGWRSFVAALYANWHDG